MPYAMFHQLFPEIAKAETRNITILHDYDWDLPAGNYGFLEMFCNEPGCDCRRVFLCVVSERTKNIVAYITYGWESRSYYRNWLGFDDPRTIMEMQGPGLNVGSPQSSLAPSLLNLVRNVLLKDEGYVNRIKHHYYLFRAKIDDSGTTRALQSKKRKKKSFFTDR